MTTSACRALSSALSACAPSCTFIVPFLPSLAGAALPGRQPPASTPNDSSAPVATRFRLSAFRVATIQETLELRNRDFTPTVDPPERLIGQALQPSSYAWQFVQNDASRWSFPVRLSVGDDVRPWIPGVARLCRLGDPVSLAVDGAGCPVQLAGEIWHRR